VFGLLNGLIIRRCRVTTRLISRGLARLQGFINQNAYYCAPYLPEAVVLFAARQVDLSPLLFDVRADWSIWGVTSG